MAQKKKPVRRGTAVIPKKDKKLVRHVGKKKVTMSVPVVNIKSPFGGFVEFIRSQGVMGLAIGLVIGTAIKSAVDSLVLNLINPFIGLITGGVNLDNKYVCLTKSVVDGTSVCTNKLSYGRFISDIISFVILMFVVYFIFVVLRLNKLDKPKLEVK